MLHPNALENYFNYFTEIEEHFQKRRGTLIILSPLDWALMEIWKDAGIPLEAVLRGIDISFDKWERSSASHAQGERPRLLRAGSAGHGRGDERCGGRAPRQPKNRLPGWNTQRLQRSCGKTPMRWRLAHCPALLKLLPGKPPKRCAGWPTRSSKAALRRWKTWSAGLR